MERIVGIGIDVVDGRSRTADPSVVARVLSENERARHGAIADPQARASFFFGRWAAKEAIFKATGAKTAFHSLDIGADAAGRPVVADVNGLRILLSISHDFAVFAAVAVAIRVE